MPAGYADLIRAGIRDRSIVTGANRAGQNFIPEAGNVNRHGVLHTVIAFHVVLRTHEVAELQAGNNAAGVGRAQQRFVHAAFESERKTIAEREDETGSAADAVGIGAALQIAEVAFKVDIAHQADRCADTDLIDSVQVVFGEYVPACRGKPVENCDPAGSPSIRKCQPCRG